MVRSQIGHFEQKYGRNKGSVQLLVVSKTRPIEDILAAITENQFHFGENYCQEALPKINYSENNPIQWHYIGSIQSNKTRQIVDNFHWVHTVDRLKIAQRFSEQRNPALPALNICIQVNISAEKNKSGTDIEGTLALAKEIEQLPNIQLRGLMAIPAATNDFVSQRRAFRTLAELKNEINNHGIELDTLSMGMSNDMEAAIAEGSTIVRIGTAIFGARN